MNKRNEPNMLPHREKRSLLKNMTMIMAGLISTVYLLNPAAGIIELIPDNIPVVGNLDEVAATILLFKVMGYFGWNPFHLLKRG